MDADNETPRDLRKKLKRITESRDLQIAKNQEKSIQLKSLRGAVDDLTISRDGWKEKKLKLEDEFVKSERKLKEAEKELEQKNTELEARLLMLEQGPSVVDGQSQNDKETIAEISAVAR